MSISAKGQKRPVSIKNGAASAIFCFRKANAATAICSYSIIHKLILVILLIASANKFFNTTGVLLGFLIVINTNQ